MMRLFIGLRLQDEARNALWNAASGLGIAGQFVPKMNYHVTMAFLGERDERQAPQIKRLAAAAAEGHPPMTLTVDGLGFFGRCENALLYAKLAPCAPLPSLAESLRRVLSEAGETFDQKPFVAHITLARKANLTHADLHAPLPPVSFRVEQLTLYHSTRVQGELRYLPIYQAELTGTGTEAP